MPNEAVIIQGQGSELNTQKTLHGRAKRKIIGQKMALSLIDCAAQKGNVERIKSYWNTFHCQNTLYKFEGKFHGQFCKNRFCPLCSSIRKAEIINRYYPVMKQWEQPYFVTLTIKVCKQPSLNKMCKGMIRAFRKINEKARKSNQRGRGIRLIGVKSLECNFNPVAKTYNPHFHLIVQSKEIAETLIAEWLRIWTRKFTIRAAQDMRPITNLESALIETIKYGSKIFTVPDIDRKARIKADPTVYALALYNIFEAMKGLRIFERFGFDLPAKKSLKIPGRVVTDAEEWNFVSRYRDWISKDSDLSLTDYYASEELLDLLEAKIDKNNE